ncbi:hypothetical protein HYALB_00003861 [Hymenoscyphus albidus]|uniref:Uncharacterized protein n=1 Tax=Hymenoscyphus albidus TaxID=595503 RepID=A0A9N9LUX4_9HELO|nr:hypothetical protein HYALB_00003861 [Hymenoscyphus albidus]
MSSSIPKSSIGALARFRCPNSSVQSRSFSSTTSRSLIGPENPRFIEIPTTKQPQVTPKRDIKGILPPPRNLFPTRGIPKTTSEYFASTIPKPTAQKQTKDEYVTWKRDLASVRRKNLREGLHALHARKLKSDRQVAHRSLLKTEERQARLYAPQREDERLTSPTVRQALTKIQRTGRLPDPQRAQRVGASQARVARKEAALEEQRRNALHTLYMHARTFISTEKDLNAEIDRIFVPQPFQRVHNSHETNIWDALGQPPTVQTMLSELNRTQQKLIEHHAGPARITGGRLKKIAEELTGGKMN